MSIMSGDAAGGGAGAGRGGGQPTWKEMMEQMASESALALGGHASGVRWPRRTASQCRKHTKVISTKKVGRLFIDLSGRESEKSQKGSHMK